MPLAFGLILNPLVFYIYSQKTFKKISATFYLKVLAIADFAVLINELWLVLGYSGTFKATVQGPFACKLLYFISFMTGSMCSWLEALVSLDRCLSITFIRLSRHLQKRSFKYSMIGGILVYNLAIYAPTLYYYNLVDGVGCVISNDSFDQAIGWYDLINSTIASFLVMFACSILSTRALVKSRKRTSSTSTIKRTTNHSTAIKHGEQSIDTNNNNSLASTTATPGTSSIHHRLSKVRQSIPKKTREEREFQFAVISISMNIVFFLFFAPTCFYSLYTSYVDMNPSSQFLFYSVTTFIYFLNFSYKFFIYFFINTKFRSELFNIKLMKLILRK